MKNYALLMSLAALLVGCAKGEKGDTGDTGPAAPVEATTPTDADIAEVLGEENAYRLALGQSVLSRGLSCTVQAVSSGQWLSSSSPGYNAGQGVVVMTGTSYSFLLDTAINQPDSSGSAENQILPAAIRPLFKNINYRISCSGQLVVLETGYYAFTLSSDDGSILTIGGSQVVNNDGNHGMATKSGTRLLRRGVTSFSLLYAQTGSGNFGLVLKANGDVIEPRFLVH